MKILMKVTHSCWPWWRRGYTWHPHWIGCEGDVIRTWTLWGMRRQLARHALELSVDEF